MQSIHVLSFVVTVQPMCTFVVKKECLLVVTSFSMNLGPAPLMRHGSTEKGNMCTSSRYLWRFVNEGRTMHQGIKGLTSFCNQKLLFVDCEKGAMRRYIVCNSFGVWRPLDTTQRAFVALNIGVMKAPALYFGSGGSQIFKLEGDFLYRSQTR